MTERLLDYAATGLAVLLIAAMVVITLPLALIGLVSRAFGKVLP